MFCVLLLFSGFLFGTISAQYGGYPNIRSSSPYLSSSFRSTGAYSSYSPHHGGKFSKGRTQILPMPYPYPYSLGHQRRRRPLILRTGRRRTGGFLGGGGGGIIGLLVSLAVLMALFPMIFNNAGGGFLFGGKK